VSESASSPELAFQPGPSPASVSSRSVTGSRQSPLAAWAVGAPGLAAVDRPGKSECGPAAASAALVQVPPFSALGSVSERDRSSEGRLSAAEQKQSERDRLSPVSSKAAAVSEPK